MLTTMTTKRIENWCEISEESFGSIVSINI